MTRHLHNTTVGGEYASVQVQEEKMTIEEFKHRERIDGVVKEMDQRIKELREVIENMNALRESMRGPYDRQNAERLELEMYRLIRDSHFKS